MNVTSIMSNYIINSSRCRDLVISVNQTAVQGLVPSVELHETLLLVIGFGCFATLVAMLFIFIRTKIYKDKVTKFFITPHLHPLIVNTCIDEFYKFSASSIVVSSSSRPVSLMIIYIAVIDFDCFA